MSSTLASRDPRPLVQAAGMMAQPGRSVLGNSVVLGAKRTDRARQEKARLLSIIARIEAIAHSEMECIKKAEKLDLAQFNNSKSQCLAELNQAMRAAAPHEIDGEVKSRLQSLRHLLDQNLKVLSMHLVAVKEIASLLSQSIQHADSDGTYTAAVVKGRQQK